MKFRARRDEEFDQTLRRRADDYFASRSLSRYGNGLLAFKAAFYTSLTLALYLLVISNRIDGWPLLAAAIAFGVASILTAFNLSHDAAHNALVRSPRINAIVYFLTFNLQGASPYLWRLRHIGSHHVLPNVEGGDADLDDNGMLRMSATTPWKPRYRYQHLYAPFLYMLFSLHWILVYDIQFLFKTSLANLRAIRHSRMEVASLILAKVTYLTLTLVVPMLRLDVPWWQVVLGFPAMHVVVSLIFVYSLIGTHFCMETAFPLATETGVVEGSWATHQLATALDYLPRSRVANFLLGGFNCHAAHHLFPGVCHVHYVPLTRIIKQTCLEFSVPYHESTYTGMLASHFRFLKRMGSRPITADSTGSNPSPVVVHGAEVTSPISRPNSTGALAPPSLPRAEAASGGR